MILHNCIECDDLEWIPLAEAPLPVIQKFVCGKCGEEQYIKHSRVNPCTYNKDSVIVDEDTKSIKVIDQ